MPSITIWTRIEPRCRSEDMLPALEARTHDPFWMLARQWQLGELRGEDAGSPILATLASVEMPLDRYKGSRGAVAAIPASMPLEVCVEREAVRPDPASVDYRQSAEAGLQFLRLLRTNELGQYVSAYLAQYAIVAPPSDQRASLDTPAVRFVGIVARRVPDGVRLARDLRAARPGLPPQPAIDAAHHDAMVQVTTAFLAWYDGLFDEPAGAPVGWVNERMEYQFALDASATDTPGTFVANQYTGDPLDWPAFDRAPNALGPVTAPPAPMTRRLIPSPVWFKGMPARRFWEIEDGNIDIGAMEAGPADLARLILREFALIYGNDWFLLPLPITIGSVCRITSLVVTDTFGVTQEIPHHAQTPDGGHWRMFALTAGDAFDHRLIVPPVIARSLDSDPIEQVLLVRDEAAMMAWGVERIYQGKSGVPIERLSTVPPPPQSSGAGTSLRYQLGTSVPENYIPFVAVSVAGSNHAPPQRRMQRAALWPDGTAIRPRGRLLVPDIPLFLFDEEFAREGVRLDRTYRLARWIDGSTHLWIARRKRMGATAGSSGLQFDVVEPV
jgi:hypothetical protein